MCTRIDATRASSWLRQSLWLFFVALLGASSACQAGPSRSPTLQANPAPGELTFVPGDQVNLRVFGEEELSGDFQVQGDGSIDMPLIGPIAAEGLTQGELASTVEAALADGYLKDPQVTVVVTGRENREVSVLGAVQKPGRMAYVDKLTLVQAISSAGGLTPLAAPKRVKLTRDGPAGPSSQIISVKAITEGRTADVRLQPGDIVFVPESAI